jgi:hypothetical protein
MKRLLMQTCVTNMNLTLASTGAISKKSVGHPHPVERSQLIHVASRFFLRKNDKPLPAPPSNASSSSLATRVPIDFKDHGSQHHSETSREGTLPIVDGTCPFPPAPRELANSPDSMRAVGSACSSSRPEVDAPKLKPRSSFATLRSKGMFPLLHRFCTARLVY